MEWGGKVLQVFFDGQELTGQIVVTQGFTAFGGADFEPELLNFDFMDGSDFSHTRKKSKTISVPFYVKYGDVIDYDRLQRILNVSEPKKLTFSHLPNRYFMAIPTGDLNFDEIKMNGKGTITFVIPDGVAHANAVRPFPFVKNAQGIFETTITNSGSESVHARYKLKIKRETGFIGLVSQHGIIQFGKPEETDGLNELKSVTLSSNQAGNFTNWRDGTTFYENTGKRSVTTMASDSYNGGRLGILSGTYTNTANASHAYGAIKELALSQTAKDWYIWSRTWFETGLMGQTGAWCLSVVDTNNRFVAGMAIEKLDRVGNTASVLFLLGDGAGGSRVVKSIDFQPEYLVSSNPYGAQSIEQKRNMFDLKKEGDKVTFFWYGQYFSFVEPRIKDTQAKLVQFFVGQIAGRAFGNQMVTRMYLNDFSFIKLNSPSWRDVPNRYRAGSDLTIDGATGRLYVNNQIAPDDEVLGTVYFKIPPGTTKVQLVTSTFGEIESASAEIEEVYI